MKNILFPTDFSHTAQQALRYGLALAAAWQARIQLLHVVFPELSAMDLPVLDTKVTQDKVEAARSLLQSFADAAVAEWLADQEVAQPPTLEINVEVGNPTAVIAQVAHRDQADLIVMGTRGEHNLLERLLGSVTTSTAQKAHCPVWIVPEKASLTRPQIVVYASDLSEHTPWQIWKLSEWLWPFGIVLHCVYVDTGQSSKGEVSLRELEAFFSQHASYLQAHYHQIAGHSVIEALDEFADQHHADLMVMYAPPHNLWERLMHPSLTRKMAMHTTIPLLLLKPT